MKNSDWSRNSCNIPRTLLRAFFSELDFASSDVSIKSAGGTSGRSSIIEIYPRINRFTKLASVVNSIITIFAMPVA